MSLQIAPRPPAPVKAATGAGVSALTYHTPLWLTQTTPQRKCHAAAMLYHENYLIRLAERPVSTKGGSVDWHLETGDDEEVIDGSPAAAIRDLLARPQLALPAEQRQPGMGTSRGMWTTTLRHMGLCGTTFWYLDQTEALGGTPLAILYLAPWRMFEVTDRQNGRLLGWTLDKPMDEGGTPLETANLLTFHLEPPDTGQWAAGLVEAAGSKAMIDPAIDRHIASVLGAGGRLTGLVSPKVGATVTPDQWAQFVRDYRQITQDPNAAQRLQIVQGPVDYVRTAATPVEIGLVDIDSRTRDAILGLWGVPPSQVGFASPAGLNSGETKGYDEAVLWQGAIGPRLSAFRETVQHDLLDRYAAVGLTVTLELEPPSFDDDAPLWAKAAQAVPLPLTVAERRAIVGLDPFGDDVVDAEGRIVDRIVTLPVGQSEAFYAGQLPQVVIDRALAPPIPEPMPEAEMPEEMPEPAKGRFDRIRRQVDTALVPKVKRAVADVLASQKADVIAYLRKAGIEHLRRKVDFRWNAAAEDRRMADALKPHLGAVATRAAERIHAALASGKADLDEFGERVAVRVLTKGAGRVVGINRTTRDRIAATITDALASAESITDVINAIEDLDVFGELRAETIARTETMFAYNDAALGSYAEFGVERVEASDGDEDEECAARNGQTFTIEEAEAIEDHPNGTLDWIPLLPDEELPE